MGELSKYINIGDKLEKQLIEVGIKDINELKKVGSKAAWLRIKKIDDSACYNRLCGLEGAIENVRWHDLKSDVKEDLKIFYNANK